MRYGVAHLSVIPCRAEASDKSEQVTQLLFGELLKKVDHKGSWCRIKTLHDNYDCWIDEKQYTPISEKEFQELADKEPMVVTDLAELLVNERTNEMMSILLGSNLPHFKDGIISIGSEKWKYEGSHETFRKNTEKKRLAENALLLINSPYQWGGRSPFGIDCSGFIQLIYKLSGYALPRDASEQSKVGQTLSFIEEAESGDLAFFDNSDGDITHVGMMLSNNQIIHASGSVRIDKLDHQGIFNADKRDYTHRLRLITKIF